MQLFSGAGQRLNREGVHPDEEIELRLEDLQSGRDPQLERAVAYLSDQARQPATAAPVTAR
jgi:C-terminal processing protease CtpA/Prc